MRLAVWRRPTSNPRRETQFRRVVADARPRAARVSLGSPSRLIFQRLTSEISRNLPCTFGHTPVVSHLKRFHEKPPNSRTTPTHVHHASCIRPQKTFFAYCHHRFVRSPPPQSEPRASASGPRKSGPPIAINTNRRPNQHRRLCICLDPLECPHATPPPLTISTFRRFDVSTFRRFDVSTFPRKTTQIANHPNPRPPQALPQSARGLCHLMSLRIRRSPGPLAAQKKRPANLPTVVKLARLVSADFSPGRSKNYSPFAQARMAS